MTSSKQMQQNTNTAREVAGILLAQGAVSINAAQPFVYASGATGPIYCDLRLLMAYPKLRERITELLVARIRESCRMEALDVVAGVATAGIPWAAWVADKLTKPLAYVRDAPKGHGKGQQVEGGVVSGQGAIVVEDLTNLGGSALAAAAALRDVGARADHCFSILTYEFPQAGEAFRAAGVELHSLCGLSTLLGVATASGQIDSEAEQAVRAWWRKGSVVAKRE
ncbi:MAG: orotate phosphoribosyltransferase [Dehalococcoidia bacterium]|nr:orotate phosphoribosyltransferase [Dehalococcoidia bacterium]